MSVATPVADLGAKLVEVTPPDCLPLVGASMQGCIMRGILADPPKSALGVGQVSLEAGIMRCTA